jgi:hypothetical protein
MFFFYKIVVLLVKGKKVQFVKLKRLKPATHNPRDVGVSVLHRDFLGASDSMESTETMEGVLEPPAK